MSLLKPYRKSTRTTRKQDPAPPDEIEKELEYEMDFVSRSEWSLTSKQEPQLARMF